MRAKVSYHVVRSAMKLIGQGTGSADFSSFGLSDEDYGILSGKRQWMAGDRTIVSRVMDVLLWGTMDAIQIPRFRISGEYKAAAICVFVQPLNVMIACEWCSQSEVNASLINGEKTLEADPVAPHELFALCLLCMEENPEQFKLMFEKRTGIEILTEN